VVRAALADREPALKVGDAASVQLDALPGKVTVCSEVGGAAQTNGLFRLNSAEPTDARWSRAWWRRSVFNRLRHNLPAMCPRVRWFPVGREGVCGAGRYRKEAVVQVAFFTRDQVALQAGLTADEQVVTDGALYLSDGESQRTGAIDHQLLEFPIRRYQFTLVAFLCLVAMGWFAFTNIAREEDPFFKTAAYSIPIIYPGADPKEIERLIVKPIEDRIAALDDVFKLETTVVDGVGVIFIQFGVNSDADKKFDEVTREVGVVRDSLAASGGGTAANITVRKWSPSYVNIVQFALVSEEAPYSELEDLADALEGSARRAHRETWAYPNARCIGVESGALAELKITPTW
jgi:hypothetical protein